MTATPTRMTLRLLAMQPGLAAALAVASSPSAAADKVIVTGTMFDMEQQSASQFQAADAELSLQEICAAADSLAMYAGPAQVELATQMARAGLDSSVLDLATENLGEAIDEACDREDEGEPYTLGPFTIVYASCMMRMESPEGTLAIRIPPDGRDAFMEVSDHAGQEATQYAMLANFTGQAAVVAGTGTSNPINMVATGSSGDIAGYPAEQHTFDYSMSLGGEGLLEEALGPAAAAGFGQTLAAMSRVTSNGVVWVSPTAPGADIVRDFYNNLAVILENTQGVGSFMSGTLRNLHGMVRDGMPLEIEQTINAAMGMTSYSWSRVETITLRPLDPGECGWTTIPEDYAVTDMNEQMSGVSDQPGGGDAMTAMSEAMQGMTPEEQAAMEQFGGLGGFLGGLVGAAAGAGNAAAAASADAAPASAAPPAGRSASLSSALMTDDLTQSAQNMLQALGYDTGNTDGELTIETTIAISQFQAEKGLEVTGEVTPQLVGILAAEVDGL